MHIELAAEAARYARISEASADNEERELSCDLRILERDIRALRNHDSVRALDSVATEILSRASAKLEVLRERQVEACLNLQICRSHRQLQDRVLEQTMAALIRTEQRRSVIDEEVASVRQSPLSSLAPLSK
jgi:hypothetical protein